MSSRGTRASIWRGNPMWAVTYTGLKRLRKSPEWLEVKGKLGEILSVFALFPKPDLQPPVGGRTRGQMDPYSEQLPFCSSRGFVALLAILFLKVQFPPFTTAIKTNA